MTDRTCTIDGCQRAAKARGVCGMHYQRLRREGRLPGLVRIKTDFWSLVDRRGVDECWSWLGALSQGYGRYGARCLKAHRLAYEQLVGPIPDGLGLDHVCHPSDGSCAGGEGCLHRRCVNPLHLRPTQHIENVLRGRAPTALNAAKTHCLRGHEFTPESTYVWPGASGGFRQCKICANERRRLRRKVIA